MGPLEYTLSGGVRALQAADLNGDAVPELVIIAQGSDHQAQIEILFGNTPAQKDGISDSQRLPPSRTPYAILIRAMMLIFVLLHPEARP